MKKANFISRTASKADIEKADLDWRIKVASYKSDKELFPEKMERGRDFFRRLKEWRFDLSQ